MKLWLALALGFTQDEAYTLVIARVPALSIIRLCINGSRTPPLSCSARRIGGGRLFSSRRRRSAGRCET
jgi:hypothetical protein